MKSGIEIIADERERQISQEGWTPEHDDEHKDDELSIAAVAYATPARWRAETMRDAGACPAVWPWTPDWWKPDASDRVRELAKAGALIAAEIDRLQRKGAR